MITAAVRATGERSGVDLFLGDPGALGLAENRYGVTGLMRRELLPEELGDGVVDPDWQLLARLALRGARIVTIPEPLSAHSGRVGSIADVPGDAVAVLETFEAHGATHDLPQFAATLASTLMRRRATAQPNARPRQPVLARALVVLRTEGPAGVVRFNVR